MQMTFPFPRLNLTKARVYLGIFAVFSGVLIVLHLNSVYDIYFLERPFPRDFQWPADVFRSDQSSDGKRSLHQLRYMDFVEGVSASAAEWQLRRNDRSTSPRVQDIDEVGPKLAAVLQQYPVIWDHRAYVKLVTQPKPGFPTPLVCSKGGAGLDLDSTVIVLVKSAIFNFQQRQTVRWTWASRREGNKYPVLFTLGEMATPSAEMERLLLDEQERFGDLVRFSVVDVYLNNTAKSVSALGYVLNHCEALEKRNEFIFMTDDDMLVNTENLEKWTRSNKQELAYTGVRSIYTGFQWDVPPDRWRLSKNYVSIAGYPFSRYPPFITAATILVSRHTAEQFYFAANFIPFFEFDDVYFGLIAFMLGVECRPANKLFLIRGNPDDQSSFVAIHTFQSPAAMIRTFRKLKYWIK